MDNRVIERDCPRCNGTGLDPKYTTMFGTKPVPCKMCEGSKKEIIRKSCPFSSMGAVSGSSFSTRDAYPMCRGEACMLWDDKNEDCLFWREYRR